MGNDPSQTENIANDLSAQERPATRTFQMSVVARTDATFIGDLVDKYKEFLANKDKHIVLAVDFSSLDWWISANALCNFLIFLDLLVTEAHSFEISVTLMPRNTDALLRSGTSLNLDVLKKIAGKLRFFNKWHFAAEVHRYQRVIEKEQGDSRVLNCYPSERLFLRWVSALSPLVKGDETRPSSTLLPISMLEPERSNSMHKAHVDTRIEYLTNILWTHIYQPRRYGSASRPAAPTEAEEEHRQAKRISHNIMHELVKNIYQHSGTTGRIEHGFATVQILKKSLLFAHGNTSYPPTEDKRPYRKSEIATALQMSGVTEDNANLMVRYLTISILDRGCGIPQTVLDHCREIGDPKADLNDLGRLEMAVFTSFTTKKARVEGEDIYYTENNHVKLSRRGHGWIYCVLFVAARLGSFNISSVNVSVTYSTTIEGRKRVLALRGQENAFDLAEQLLSNPLRVFNRVVKTSKANFPGTRVLIELPINYRWFLKEQKHLDQQTTLLESQRKKLDKVLAHDGLTG